MLRYMLVKYKKNLFILLVGFILGVSFSGASYLILRKAKPFLKKAKQKIEERWIANLPKEKKTLVICDFEGNTDLDKWECSNCRIELTSKHTTSGKKAAKIYYQPTPGAAAAKIERFFKKNKKVTNWSGYEVLAFDMFNPNPAQERVILQVKDRNGSRFKHNLYLRPNENNHIAIDIGLLWGKIKVNEIGQLNLFLWNNKEKKSFYLDNIKLIPQAEIAKAKKTIFAKEFIPKKDEKLYAGEDYFAFNREKWLKIPSGHKQGIVQVPLVVDNYLSDNLTVLPFRGGIPFAKGEIHSSNKIEIVDSDGNSIPFQIKELSHWPDGSIKWMLVTLKSSIAAEEKKSFYLRYGNNLKGKKQSSSLSVKETPREIIVDTGGLRFSVDKKNFYLFDKVWQDKNGDKNFDNDEVVTSNVDLIIVHKGKKYHSYLDKNYSLTIEEKGPLMVCLKAKGWFTSERGKKFCQFITRIYAFSGSDFVKVKHTFVYTGYPENKYHYLYEGKRLPANETIEEIYIKTPRNITEKDKFTYVSDNKVMDIVIKDETFLMQKESNRSYVSQKNGVVSKGEKSGDWVDISNFEGGVSVGIKDLWQQFPKGFRIDKESRSVITYLWPKEAGELDLKTTQAAEGPGACARGSAFGLAKTHDVIFYFHKGAYTESVKNVMEGLSSDMVIQAIPEWISDTRALGRLAPYNDKVYLFGHGERFLNSLFDWGTRHIEGFNWYGMTDFGDTLSWYRKDAYDKYYDTWGWHPEGRWGWFNCEAMGTHSGALIQFLRTSDYKYLNFGANLSRHIMDIDTCHYNTVINDRRLRGKIPDDYSQVGSMHRHNGNHWGGRNEEASHTNVFGLILYYYITGDERAKDVIEEVGSFFLKEPITYFKHPDIAPHRAISNILWGDILLYELTADEKYIKQADRLANLLYLGQLSNGGWLENYDPVTNRWKGKIAHHYIGYYTIPALIEYHKQTGNKAIASCITKATGYLIKNATYLPFFDALAYSYWLTQDKKIIIEGERRLKLVVNHQKDGEDPIWDGMLYDKPYYLRPAVFLYSTPWIFEVLKEDGD